MNGFGPLSSVSSSVNSVVVETPWASVMIAIRKDVLCT